MQLISLKHDSEKNSCENSWYESFTNAPENHGVHLSRSLEIIIFFFKNPPHPILSWTSCSEWIFRKLNTSKPYHLTGCLCHFPLSSLIIFGFIINMPAGKTFPRNAAGRVRKYFEHFVYNLHFLSCVGTPVSECSSTSHRGTKAFLVSPLSRLITKNKSVFIFYGYNIDKKMNELL